MDYTALLKQEIEKTLFIEIKKPIKLKLKGDPVLEPGDYPILAPDIVKMASNEDNGIPLYDMIEGMTYMIACDKSFVHNKRYIDFLRNLENFDKVLEGRAAENKKADMKKSIIYLSALSEIYPTKENMMKRIYMLMDYYDKNSTQYIKDEIVKSLESLIERYPDYTVPYLHMGEYYLNNDNDKAKIYFNKALQGKETHDIAQEMMERIRNVEKYDDAVEMVKHGNGSEALETLSAVVSDDPERFDAVYYLAMALRQCERYDEALCCLDELLNNGKLPEVFSEKGLCLAALSNFEEALENFDKALELKPKDASLMCNAGVCKLNLGDIEGAKICFEKAHRIAPKDEIIEMWQKYMQKF